MSPPYDTSNDDQYWKTIDVSQTPLSKKALQKYINLCKDTGASSQIVIYNGKIVSEWYSDTYKEPVAAMSSTKVIASILIGTLIDEKRFDYSTKYKEIVPEWNGNYRDDVLIDQLLTHTAGFSRRLTNDSVGYAKNKTEYVLTLYPDSKPGEKYEYSNEGVQLLEAVISRTTNKKTDEYAKEVLFDPVGMKNTKLYNYGGTPWLYAEMQTTTRDMARIGVLMKNDGMWNGKRIVSKEYIEKATNPIKLSKEMGYLWWILDKDKTVEGYYASGYLNTDIYVLSKHNVVIVRTQAPKNGFSGKNEAGDYFNKAMLLFKRIVNEK